MGRPLAEVRVFRDDIKRRVDTLLDELGSATASTSERLTIRLSAFDVSTARSVTT